jgi:hypothetical protein
MVGEPVESCPTAMGLADHGMVAWMATMLPGPDGPGAIRPEDVSDLPPRWQAAYEMAKVWRDVFVGKDGAS